MPNQIEAEIDVPLTSSQMMERTQFCATRFYKEWARPQGYEDVAGVQFLRQADRVAYNSFYFPRELGPAADDVRETLAMLAPHLRRAALIGDLLELRTIEAEQFRAVVDQLALGVMLVDHELRLLHANRCGSELLDLGQPLTLAHGRVRAFDPKINAALREIIRRLDRDGTSVSRAGMCIPAHFADGRPAVMHVLPQRTGSPRARLDRAAAAALFVAVQTGGPPTWRDAMAALYDLTKAEQRVLTLLVEGLATEEITDRLNIGLPTLKTHLLRLFAKTGTARRGELIALAREFTLPVGGSAQ